MFGSSTTSTSTGFGGFGTPSTTTTASTSAPPTTSLFGGGGFGNTSTNTPATNSLFGSNTTASTSAAPPTGSLFGNTTTASSTAPPSLSLFGSTPTSTSAAAPPAASTSLFGSGLTTSAPTTTPSLFGSTPSSSAAAPSTTSSSLFGGLSTSTAPTTTSTSASFFGAKPTATPTTTNSLFGGGLGSSSLFGGSTQQQQGQQAQQQQSLLDLSTVYPDKSIPQFIVTPERVSRTTVPANFFHMQKKNDAYNDVISSGTAMNLDDDAVAPGGSDQMFTYPLSAGSFIERTKVLPHYLTSSDNGTSTTNNNKTIIDASSKKRVLDENKDQGRNVLFKKSQGVFSHNDSMTFGFDRNLLNKGSKLPPTDQLKEVGMQPVNTAYQLSPTTSTTTTTATTTATATMDTTSYTNNTLLLTGQQDKITKQPDDRTRVRVFGYDDDNFLKVIKKFEEIGQQATEYQNRGNWILIEYRSHQSALKALELNGKELEGRLIGVTWDDESLQQVENRTNNLIYTKDDLFTKSNDPLFSLFGNSKTSSSSATANQQQTQQQQQPKQPSTLERIRESLFGW